jgi:hypothetical protein
VEWVIQLADGDDTELVEWAMERDMGRRLVAVGAQETLLCGSVDAEREAQAKRREAVGTDTVLAERENGRVCVSRDVREALARLLGLRVSSWEAVVGIRRADSRALLSKAQLEVGFRGFLGIISSWTSMETLS